MRPTRNSHRQTPRAAVRFTVYSTPLWLKFMGNSYRFPFTRSFYHMSGRRHIDIWGDYGLREISLAASDLAAADRLNAGWPNDPILQRNMDRTNCAPA